MCTPLSGGWACSGVPECEYRGGCVSADVLLPIGAPPWPPAFLGPRQGPLLHHRGYDVMIRSRVQWLSYVVRIGDSTVEL